MRICVVLVTGREVERERQGVGGGGKIKRKEIKSWSRAKSIKSRHTHKSRSINRTLVWYHIIQYKLYSPLRWKSEYVPHISHCKILVSSACVYLLSWGSIVSRNILFIQKFFVNVCGYFFSYSRCLICFRKFCLKDFFSSHELGWLKKCFYILEVLQTFAISRNCVTMSAFHPTRKQITKYKR